ncbi:hypothetical protein Tco_0993859 [Tanacetum coccineum]
MACDDSDGCVTMVIASEAVKQANRLKLSRTLAGQHENVFTAMAARNKSKIISALGVNNEALKDGGCTHIASHTFTLREVAAAAKNFRADCLLGERGFRIVYRGRLESTNQVIKMSVLLTRKKEEAEDKMFESGTGNALCG